MGNWIYKKHYLEMRELLEKKKQEEDKALIRFAEKITKFPKTVRRYT